LKAEELNMTLVDRVDMVKLFLCVIVDVRIDLARSRGVNCLWTTTFYV